MYMIEKGSRNGVTQASDGVEIIRRTVYICVYQAFFCRTSRRCLFGRRTPDSSESPLDAQDGGICDIFQRFDPCRAGICNRLTLFGFFHIHTAVNIDWTYRSFFVVNSLFSATARCFPPAAPAFCTFDRNGSDVAIFPSFFSPEQLNAVIRAPQYRCINKVQMPQAISSTFILASLVSYISYWRGLMENGNSI